MLLSFQFTEKVYCILCLEVLINTCKITILSQFAHNACVIYVIAVLNESERKSELYFE